jgi:hypothetical protein
LNKPRQTSLESPESPNFFLESPGFPEKKSGEKVRNKSPDTPGFYPEKSPKQNFSLRERKGKKAKLDQTTSKNHEI